MTRMDSKMLAIGIGCLILMTLSTLKCSEQEVVFGNDFFSRQMYNELAEEDGNIFFSPLSIHLVLSMVALGAAGDTAESLPRALHVSNVDAAGSGYGSLLTHLNNVQNIDLFLANRLFAAHDTCLKDDFQKKLQTHFKSDVQLIDVSEGSAAVAKINSWVENQTNHKIENLLNDDAIDPDTQLVLVSTINLAAKWKIPFFDSADEPNSTFYLPNNETVEVQYMARKEGFKVKHDEELEFTVVDLPFINENASMVFILPDETSDIKQLERTMYNLNLERILKDTVETDGKSPKLYIPKLNLEKELNLQEILEKLHFGELFSSPNLDEMLCNDVNVTVSQVVQKVVLNMDEVGIEAAGATYTELSVRTLEETIEFNRPFMFLIREGENILFHGRIVDPTETY